MPQQKTGFFITGTDTGIGKTWATLCLMRELQARGWTVAAMKPVATGGFFQKGRLVNEDALALQAAASVDLPYEWINPFVYEPPVSPHIAAAEAGIPIVLGRVREAYAHLNAVADCVLVEGVGGWAVPLGHSLRVADLAAALELPVILVVGLRLGCLNHALLTREAIMAAGVEFAGWIANQIEDGFPRAPENIATLAEAWGVPPLATLPHGGAISPLFHGEFPKPRRGGTLHERCS